MAGDVAPIAPSLEELSAVVERACRPPMGNSRIKQLRWVAGEIRHAVDRKELPTEASRSLADLLAPTSVAAYLDAAERGVLRRKPAAKPEQASAASMRVRENCLEIIGQNAGVPIVLPTRDDPIVLHPVIAARPRSILLGHLEEQADNSRQDPGRLRILAMLGVVMDTGSRSGELCVQRLGHLAPDLRTIQVTRLPQNRDLDQEPMVETVALSAPTQSALRAWLKAREHLVRRNPQQPGVGANSTTDFLWVSVAPNGTRPVGMPLQFRGLARAYGREVSRLNIDMAGAPGWQPMPGRMEQLRRAVELELAEVGGAPVLRRAPSAVAPPEPWRKAERYR